MNTQVGGRGELSEWHWLCQVSAKTWWPDFNSHSDTGFQLCRQLFHLLIFLQLCKEEVHVFHMCSFSIIVFLNFPSSNSDSLLSFFPYYYYCCFNFKGEQEEFPNQWFTLQIPTKAAKSKIQDCNSAFPCWCRRPAPWPITTVPWECPSRKLESVFKAGLKLRHAGMGHTDLTHETKAHIMPCFQLRFLRICFFMGSLLNSFIKIKWTNFKIQI